MKPRLQIGDKIRWDDPINLNSEYGEIIYTILDIDTSRPTEIINGLEVKKEILFQWEYGGRITQVWSHDYQKVNQLINEGLIVILNPKITPIKWIKKSTF